MFYYEYPFTFVTCLLFLLYFTSKRFRFIFRISIVYLIPILSCGLTLPYVFLCRKDVKKVFNVYSVIGRFVFKLFSIDVEVRGTENVKTNEAGVVVFNHQSSLDICTAAFLWQFLKPALPALKREMQYIPFVGRSIQMTGCALIDRVNTARD